MYTAVDRFKYIIENTILIGGIMTRKDFDELLESQRVLRSRVVKEHEMDETIDILAIINEMAPYPDQKLQKEAVFIEALGRGFSHEISQKVIDNLIHDRILFEPEAGYIQRR
jgi:hypothetical protein